MEETTPIQEYFGEYGIMGSIIIILLFIIGFMYLIGDAIKDLYDFSKDFKENPSLTDLIDSINHLLLSIGAGLAIGIAVTAFCLGLLIIYRTRKLEKDE